jgi:sarcosine oxidase subunit gamma
LAIVNLRGDTDDPSFRAGVSRALGLTLPTQACTSVATSVYRLVWVGPDDWFLVGPKGQARALEGALRKELAGTHHAATDVSGGYTVLQLSGRPVREVMAQGCPLDLHPRTFQPGSSAGSLFFKASIWLWQVDEAPVFEMLVRSSFMGYVWLMLERSTRECGLITRKCS